MFKIDGVITDKFIEGYPIVLNTYLIMEIVYSSNVADTVSNLNAFVTNLQGNVKLYLKELPEFEEVYATFISKRKLILRQNKQLDICLSLFYEPYFSEFYQKFKSSYEQVPKQQIKYLKKNMLNILAGPIYRNITNGSCVSVNTMKYEYLKEKDIFNKSKELLCLLDKK